MRAMSLSCAVLVAACAAQAAEVGPAGRAVEPASDDVVASAIDADQAIAERVAKIHAYPQTQQIVGDIAAAMKDVAKAQADLTSVRERVWSAHPDVFGQSDVVAAAVERANAAARRAIPDGHALAEGYYAWVPRLIQHDPDGPIAEGDAAMEVAIANLQRAVAEINKQGARLTADLIERGDHELGYRDVRVMQKAGDDSGYQQGWETLKKRISTEKGAASLKEKAVFAEPESRMAWDD